MKLGRLEPSALDRAWDFAAWPPPGWEGAAALDFAQAWREAPEPGLRPGKVWLATTPTAFAVLAELADDDIATAAQRHNDPLWDLGDVFEIFTRHVARSEYFEFHMAPNGVTLDLRYPRLYASRANGVEPYMLDRPRFSARVRAEPELHRWRVAAELPVRELVPAGLARAAGEWQFSFSRYDCGPGRPPIFSSTSPHRRPDFHEGRDWRLFHAPPFTPGAAARS
jgi:hypothetical protein